MYKHLFYLLLILVLSNKVFAQKTFVLVNNARSNYKIIIPADATDIEKQSATVLQDYIQKISNCKIPVTAQNYSTSAQQIIIGRNKIIPQRDMKGLGDDGFIIKKINNSLILTGGSRKGTLYSVYTLLEDYLECRMYTSKDIDIPHKSTIILPSRISKREVPSFYYRTTFFQDAYNKDYCDFHKMNTIGEGFGLWFHSFEALVPKAQYFQSHPEYYALVNGKRTADQLCFTNPEVLKVLIQHLQTFITARPNDIYWSVSQNDNDNYCECEKCKKLNDEQGSVQGSMLPFVNKVAAHFPDKFIPTLAFRRSEVPPKTIKPLPNVLITLCTTYDERRVPYSIQPLKGFDNDFKNWSAITSRLYIWDYIAPLVNSLSPFPNYYTMQPNVQYFASRNVTHLFLEGIGEFPGEFSELRTYMASRVMWNKNVNMKATMSEFINGYYGPNGGKYISSYINLLDKNASLKPVGLRSGGGPLDAMNAYLSAEDIKTYKSIFLNAVNATAGTVYNARVMKEYLPVLYAELEINKTRITPGKVNPADKVAAANLLNDFYKKAKQLNIVYLNEARMTVDDYYKSYNEVLGNIKR